MVVTVAQQGECTSRCWNVQLKIVKMEKFVTHILPYSKKFEVCLLKESKQYRNTWSKLMKYIYFIILYVNL